MIREIELLRVPGIEADERATAFSRVVQTYQDMAFGYAYALLGDAHLAEDATQEAFLAAWQELPKLKEPEAFPGWLKRIVHTQCTRLTRRKRLYTVELTEGLGPDLWQGDPETTTGAQETEAELRLALQTLPEHERLAVVLYYLDEYTQAEIATFLGIMANTVKQRLFSARKRLQGALGEQVKSLLAQRKPSRDDSFVNLVRMLVAVRCVANPGIDGLEIAVRQSNGGFAVTPGFYRVPMRVDLVAKTDSTNIRLRYAQGQVILNWEWFPNELRWWDPATAHETGVEGKGSVPVDTWVHISWLVEERSAELRVNGEVRFRCEGTYTGLSGQVGIGAAHGSTVTVKSFRVTGAKADEGIPIRTPPRFDPDNGVVAVPHEAHQAAIRWYSQHLDLTFRIADEIRSGQEDIRISYLEFPGGKGLVLKSPGPIHPDTGRQRILVATSDWQAAQERLKGAGITQEGQFQGPGGALHQLIRDPGAPTLFRPAGWQVTARDLLAAANWYRRYLGINVVETNEAEGYLLMAGGFKIVKGAAEMAPAGPTQPHFTVREIETEHRRLKEAGVPVSPLIASNSGHWKSFSFEDLDRNQLFAWRWD